MQGAHISQFRPSRVRTTQAPLEGSKGPPWLPLSLSNRAQERGRLQVPTLGSRNSLSVLQLWRCACGGPGRRPKWAQTAAPTTSRVWCAEARLPPTLRGILPRRGSQEIKNKSDWNKKPPQAASTGHLPPLNSKAICTPSWPALPGAQEEDVGSGEARERKSPFRKDT